MTNWEMHTQNRHTGEWSFGRMLWGGQNVDTVQAGHSEDRFCRSSNLLKQFYGVSITQYVDQVNIPEFVVKVACFCNVLTFWPPSFCRPSVQGELYLSSYLLKIADALTCFNASTECPSLRMSSEWSDCNASTFWPSSTLSTKCPECMLLSERSPQGCRPCYNLLNLVYWVSTYENVVREICLQCVDVITHWTMSTPRSGVETQMCRSFEGR